MFAQELMIPSGSTFIFEISGTSADLNTTPASTFTVDRLDLIGHLKTDRFNTGSAETRFEPSITFLNEGDLADATVFNNNISTISQSVAANFVQQTILKPMFFVKHNVTSSTSFDLTNTIIPIVDGPFSGSLGSVDGYNCSAGRLDLFYASSGLANGLATMALNNQLSSSTALSASLASTAVSGSKAVIANPSVQLTASAGRFNQSSGSNDYGLSMRTTSTVPLKLYGYIWIK